MGSLERIAAALEELVSLLKTSPEDPKEAAVKGGIIRALTATRDDRGHFVPAKRQPAGGYEVVAELKPIDGSDLLKNIKPHVQVAWVKAFSLALIQRELPTAAATWESDDNRQILGRLPLYLCRWFQNAKDKRATATPSAPVAKSTSVVSESEIERTRRQIAQIDATKYDPRVGKLMREYLQGET